ncbi:hypothetical protein J7E49_21860 [Variovorax paradoxus]|nr:hypothetical protein [Variovorax paradoxus]
MEITEDQLEHVAEAMQRIGHAKFHRNYGTPSGPRLVRGIELLNARNDWAISLFRNVNNEANDVEIAMAPARIVDDVGQAGAAMVWLEAIRSQFQHVEHKPHRGRYKGPVFRIGLKQGEARAFLELVMSEVLKPPSKAPWNISGPQAGQTAQAATPPSHSGEERANAIAHMVAMALGARDQSGQERSSIAKDKQVRFDSAAELQAHLATLWNSDHCALSGLKMEMSRNDPDLTPSLDRIDSSKHYEPGNLQVVARFINRWKSDDDESNFLRLLDLVRAQRVQ